MSKSEPAVETLVTEPVSAGSAFGTLGKRFVLGEELGRGGMGRVVAATDVTLGREVAIKQVLTDDREMIARFDREVRITAQLEHPSIVALHEAGHDGSDLPFYVMRRIAGEALAARLAKADGVRARMALLPSVVAVVDAAAFAHAKRIVHRDIKPANVMLGPYGEAYLIDWGIARHLDDLDGASTSAAGVESEELTRAGALYGTVAYMAPEQARGETVDERADVFALGATLFHVLAGRAPFVGLSAAQRISNASEGEEVPLAVIPPDVPRDLVAIVGKAMAYEPADRYRNAGELAQDLRAFLAGQLVAAHHYTAAQRMARFVRRHLAAVIVVAAVTVAALVFGVISIRKLVDARGDAESQRALAEDNAATARAAAAKTLLQHAASLTPTDPTRGALMVRSLLDDEEHGPAARDLIAAAATIGIAHGIHVPTNLSQYAALSPDGRQLAICSQLYSVYVLDLATGTGKTIARLDRAIDGMLWPEDQTIVAFDSVGMLAIAPATRAVRTIVAAKLEHAWYSAKHRTVRYVDMTHRELREVALAGGTPGVLVSDVNVAHGDDETALLYGRGELRMWSGGREILLEGGVEVSHARRLAIARDGRVAAALDQRVTAWDSQGRPIHTWKIDRPSHVRFVGSQLTAIGLEGVISLSRSNAFELAKLEARRWPDHRGEMAINAMLAESSSGAAFAFTDGRIEVADRFSYRKLPYRLHGIINLLASPASPYIVAVYRSGEVRWWKLTDLTLHRHDLLGEAFALSSLCWVSQTKVFMAGVSAAAFLDRRTGEKRSWSHPYFLTPVRCLGMIGNAVFLTDLEGRTARFDVAEEKLELLHIPNKLIVDEVAGVVLAARDRSLVELTGGRGPERVRWTAPGPIRWLVGGNDGNYLAYVEGGGIHRFDRTSGEVVEIEAHDPDWMAVDAAGTAYWTTRSILWSRTRTAALPIVLGKLSARNEFTVAQRGEGLMIGLSDGSTWIASPRRGLLSRDLGPYRNRSADDAGRVASRLMLDDLAIHHVRSGVSFTRTVAGPASLWFDSEGHLLIKLAESMAEWRMPVTDSTDVAAWLATATNADLVGDIVRWPTHEID